MPRDIFGGKPKGPSNADIEREAKRELDRLTRATGPNMGAMGGIPGGIGGGAAPPSFGPRSPLEAMAENLQKKKVRKKRSGLKSGEDRKAWGNDGFAPASISGSVGSALDFGGGVAPGMMRKAPPADAAPMKRRTTADSYDEDDDPDDDVGVTELALRDHAERFGKNLEDMVIRSDPATAEAMRAAAMQKYMQRAAPPESDSDFTPPARLNLRRRGRLRPVAEEPEPEVDEVDEQAEPEPEEQELHDIEQELAAEQEGSPREPRSGPQLGLMVDERARLAERRAELAEERARLAEERAEEAEFQLTVAAELFADYERRLDELGAPVTPEGEAAHDEVDGGEGDAVDADELYEGDQDQPEDSVDDEEIDEAEDDEHVDEDVAEESSPPPPRRSRRPPAKGASASKRASSKRPPAKRAPAKRAPAKRAPAAKKASANKSGRAKAAPVAKKAPAKKTGPAQAAPVAKKAAQKQSAPPPPPPLDGPGDDAPRLGGVLGRRLAEQRTTKKVKKA